MAGFGKTTVARHLAALGVPHVELDAIHHLPGWTPRPLDEIREIVGARVAGGDWVVDGNYADVQDLVWSAADIIAWLDLSRPTVTRRVIRRSLRRAATREGLWNGNRERFRYYLKPDPLENIILWTWTQHRRYRAEYAARLADPAWSHLDVVRLTKPRDIAAWSSAQG